MIIAWLTCNVSPTVHKSFMYMSTAHEIWTNLETRFSITNGSRKYKLNKELYEIRQNNKPINEYYTQMKSLWEELDCMNIILTITTPTEEVKKLLSTIELHREESRLFQFLNGVDELYNSQRSQLIMMAPLPNVELACSVLMQEEAQREILNTEKNDDSILAMFGKSNQTKPKSDRFITCTACGVRGHSGEKCWTIVGYPKWHPKNPKFQQSSFQPKKLQKWSPGNQTSLKIADVVKSGEMQNTSFSPQQLEQLMKLIPQLKAANINQSDTYDKLDHFSGMITCY